MSNGGHRCRYLAHSASSYSPSEGLEPSRTKLKSIKMNEIVSWKKSIGLIFSVYEVP